MATKALTGLVADWYTPFDQRPALKDPDQPESEDNPLIDVDNPTRYKLKPLDGIQMMEVAANGEQLADDSFMPSHRGRLMLLRAGIKDWEFVNDHKGERLQFNLTRLRFMPTAHLVECSNELLERSALGEEDSKN